MNQPSCTGDMHCPELDIAPRKTLYGSTATNRDFIHEIIRLRLGDARRHQQTLNNTQVATTLGVSTDFVQEKLKMAAAHKFCELEPSGRLKIPETTSDLTSWQRLQEDDFAKHPLIADWIQYMRHQNGGTGLVRWQDQLHALRVVCNTLKIRPDQLIINKTTTEKLWLTFMDALVENRIEITNKHNKVTKIAHRQKRYKNALRGFCSRFGMTWARGENEIMGNKKVEHGQFAHIRLTDEEFVLADDYLKKNFGVDSDMYRVFWVGVESCARDKALLSMKCEWDKITDADSETFVMRAFESKTKKHNGGWWEKFITRKETQESLRAHKMRGNALIWTNANSSTARQFRDRMRELFAAIGKIPNLDELRRVKKINTTTDNYFFDHPIHALRHIGAHYWLALTDYDYGVVAEWGGWMTIDELKKSYGAMPAEIKYKKLKAAKMKTSMAVAA